MDTLMNAPNLDQMLVKLRRETKPEDVPAEKIRFYETALLLIANGHKDPSEVAQRALEARRVQVPPPPPKNPDEAPDEAA